MAEENIKIPCFEFRSISILKAYIKPSELHDAKNQIYKYPKFMILKEIQGDRVFIVNNDDGRIVWELPIARCNLRDLVKITTLVIDTSKTNEITAHIPDEYGIPESEDYNARQRD